jgi:membrane-bound ClpP family serine protease
MSIALIIIILLLGLLLIIAEIFFIPGTTIFGVAGGVVMVIGVAMMYAVGTQQGHIALGISIVSILVATVLGFRAIDKGALAARAKIKGRVNELDSSLVPGMKGKAITELRPGGKVQFGEERVEVFSYGNYIPRDSQVEITNVTKDKIFVKLTSSDEA